MPKFQVFISTYFCTPETVTVEAETAAKAKYAGYKKFISDGIISPKCRFIDYIKLFYDGISEVEQDDKR